MRTKRPSKLLCFAFAFTILFLIGGKAAAQTAKKEEISIGRDRMGRKVLVGHVFYNETIFINDDKSPVRILNVTARHIPRETVASVTERLSDFKELARLGIVNAEIKKRRKILLKFAREGLKITIDAEGPKADAVKFGVIVYDAFKEFLGGLTAVTMESPRSGMVWDFRPAYLFKFKQHGVVAVYVRQVRLKNGKIWNFSPGVVLKEISKRYKKLTKEQLLKTG